MDKLYKNKKQSFFIIVLITFILITICLLRLFSSAEDYWLCKNGTWVKHGRPSSSFPSSVCPPSNSTSLTPTQLIEHFYNWYFHIEGNPVADGYYKSSDYLTWTFKKKVDSNHRYGDRTSYDPFICNHTENPISFSAQEIYSKDNKALVMVYQNYVTTQDRLEISLIKKRGFWYISNINCAKPFDSVKGIDVNERNSSQSNQFQIFFSNLKNASDSNDCSAVFAVNRSIKSNNPELKDVLSQLLTGPSDVEKKEGYTSWFSSKTKTILKEVKVKGDTAYVNFTDFRKQLPNVSSSCGYAQFNSSIHKTIASNFGVNKVVYAINNDPKVFYDWVQVGCGQENGNCDSAPFQQ